MTKDTRIIHSYQKVLEESRAVSFEEWLHSAFLLDYLSISAQVYLKLSTIPNSLLLMISSYKLFLMFKCLFIFQAAGFNNEVDLGMDTKNETLFLP